MKSGIADKNKIRLAITDIGFYPNKMYYLLKI